MGIIYQKPGLVSVEYEGDGIIVVHWQNLGKGEIVKECCLTQLGQVKRGGKVIIVNTAEATGAPPQDIQLWFGTTLFPAMRDAGVKVIITVVPQSAVTSLACKRWSKTGEPFDFAMFDADSVSAARELAQRFL